MGCNVTVICRGRRKMTQLEMWKARVWQRRPQPPQEGSSKDDNKKRSRVILEQNLREVRTASHWKNVDSISSGAGAGAGAGATGGRGPFPFGRKRASVFEMSSSFYGFLRCCWTSGFHDPQCWQPRQHWSGPRLHQ